MGRGGVRLNSRGGVEKESLQRLASLPKQGSTNCEHRDQINLVLRAGYLVFGWVVLIGGGHT